MQKVVSFFTPAKLLVVLVVVASIVRLAWLGSLPAELHLDELSIGYNGWALVETGRGEHGEGPWPLSFEAFGEYKLPGMVYSVAASFWLLGENVFSLRFPTALAGILTIPASFWLFKEMGWKKGHALVVAALLSTTWWHVANSRDVFEPVLGLLLSTTAWASFLRSSKNWKWSLAAVFLSVFAVLSYNVPLLLLPVLGAFSLVIFWVSSAKKTQFLQTYLAQVVTLLAWIAVSIVFLVSVGSVNQSRAHASIFGPVVQEEIHQQVFEANQGGLPLLVTRVVYNRYLAYLWQMGSSYAAAFDPNFLFFSGDRNAWHNLASLSLGNINPILVLPIGLGVWYLLNNWREPKTLLLAAYLILSPVPQMVTTDAPVINRLFDFHLAVLMVASVGLVWWWQQTHQYWRYALGLFLAVYLSLNLLFWARYFGSYNALLESEWAPGSSQAIEQLQDLLAQNPDAAVVISDHLVRSYIYYWWYGRVVPDQSVWQAERLGTLIQPVVAWQNVYFERGLDARGIPDAATLDQITTQNPTAKQVLVLGSAVPTPKSEPVWQLEDAYSDPIWNIWLYNLAQLK